MKRVDEIRESLAVANAVVPPNGETEDVIASDLNWLVGEIDRLEEINGDLLAAVKHALKVLGPEDEHPTDLVRHLQSAVAKAEGETDE